MIDIDTLRASVDRALGEGKPEDAVCYLAEMVAGNPDNLHSRVALAISLGDAGLPAGALRVLRVTADRLAHDGLLLPAIVVIRHGLNHAPNDPSLTATLKRLHVRGVRAKAGSLPSPPPLKSKKETPDAATAATLLSLSGTERLEKVAEIGVQFPPAGDAAIPLPLPLFCELDPDAFVETVHRLHYKRVQADTKLLVEGEAGHTLLIIASGHVRIEKGGRELARIGPGSVLGEMALITGSPRSATAVAAGEVELFELAREDVQALAQSKPAVAEELVDYCRKRLIDNLLRTSPLFERFDDTTRYELLDQFARQGYQTGAHIIDQGARGNGLYVIASGEVEVAVAKDDGDSVVVANLGPGEVFGEISLLNDQPTSARVSARGQVGVLFLPREHFQKVLDGAPEVRTYLEGLSHDRLEASQDAAAAQEVLDADDLIIL